MNARLLIARESALSVAWQPTCAAHHTALLLVVSRSIPVAALQGGDEALERLEEALVHASELANQPRDPRAPRLPDPEARALFDVVDAAWLTQRAALDHARARGTASRRATLATLQTRLSALRSALS